MSVVVAGITGEMLCLRVGAVRIGVTLYMVLVTLSPTI